MTDETDTDARASRPARLWLDIASFTPELPQWDLPAFRFSRALLAVMAATNPDEPIVIVEEYEDGIQLIGTDRGSLLVSWVGYLDGGDDEYPSDGPRLDEQPAGVWMLGDYAKVAAGWANRYAKRKRYTDHPNERVQLVFGKVNHEDHPTLSDEFTQRACRLSGAEVSVVLTELIGQTPPDWRKVWTDVLEHGRPTEDSVAMNPARLSQLGKLAAMAPETRVLLTTLRIADGGRVMLVAVPGNPPVDGIVVAISDLKDTQ